MFELTVLGINVILPSILTLLGVALGYRLSGAVESRHETERPLESNRTVELVRGVCVAAASALAIWSAVALRNEWAIWHEDAWMRLPTGVALVALAAAVTTGMNFVWLAWLIRGVAVLTAALAIFPSGEAWGDLLPTKNLWLASITLSTLVAWFLMERRGSRDAAVLGLSWILLLIVAAYLTSQSFLKVTEPLMAVASVLGCLSLLSLRRGSSSWVATAVGPCLFAFSAAVASAQFNSFLGLPDALSWLAMASPGIAAALTQWTSVGHSQIGSRKKNLWATLLVCLLMAVAIVAWTQWALPSGGEEW